MGPSAPQVSVVVPVFEPGEDIDVLLASLFAQTLPAADFEVILVDDGSSDDTAKRLEAAAAERPNVRFERIEHTGWPSRPRNVGLGLAQGEFVFFADQDDRLDPEALERLLARAREDGADVVVGKVVGHGKPVPQELFARNRRRVTLEWEPLVRLLTPHKLFRRALLDEHDIRFPEDGKRLEDHVFVLQAYFKARGISVLADRPVYHWIRHEHGRNASNRRLDPESYYGRVAELLELVDANTEPGPLRDQLYVHYLRSKLLARLSSTAFLERRKRHNRHLYETIQQTVAQRFSPEVERRLPFRHRLRGGLLRADDFQGLKALARFESRLRARGVLLDLVDDGETKDVRLELWLATDKKPLTARMDGVRLLWEPPPRLAEALAAADLDLDLSRILRRASADVALVSTADGAEFPLKVRATMRLDPVPGDGVRFRPVVVVDVRVDPRTAAAGRPLPPGTWKLVAAPVVGGFTARARRFRPLDGSRRRALHFDVGRDGRFPRPRTWRARAARRLPARVRRQLRRRRRSGGAGAPAAGRRGPHAAPSRS